MARSQRSPRQRADRHLQPFPLRRYHCRPREKIFPDPVWKRRYKHVLDFESMLVEEGTVIIKLFLNISKEEQKNGWNPDFRTRINFGNSAWTTWMTGIVGMNSRQPTRISLKNVYSGSSLVHHPGRPEMVQKPGCRPPDGRKTAPSPAFAPHSQL